MIYLILALIALGIVAALLSLLSHNKDGEPDVICNEGSSCATCNGDNDKCEQVCMMEAATRDIEYFDDEELDAFRLRPSDAYTDEEVEQFRDVMYSMQPKEVKDWNRSLILRQINVPDQMKDELILLLDES